MSQPLGSVSAPDKNIIKTLEKAIDPDSSCKKEVCPTDSYAKAVKGLAVLDGNEKLEESDFNALGLRCNLPVLADLIESDPYFQGVILKGEKVLKKGATEIVSSNHLPSVPPTYYKRMVYMMQVALRHLVDPKLPTTGVYGKQTAKAVAEFQKLVGIEDGNEGEIAGYKTLGMLAMRCRMNKDELLTKLKASQGELAEKGPFFYYDSSSTHPPKHGEEAREAIGDALKWLGLIKVNTPAASNAAFDALKEMYGQYLEDKQGMEKKEADFEKEQLSLIGKNVMQMVIDAVMKF